MKKLVLPVVGLGLFAAGLFAGEALITGSGTVSKPVEFVTVRLDVVSECYPTPSGAMAANNQAAAAVQNILKTHVASNGTDSVHTNGGYTHKFSKTVYVNSHSTTICENTFQQTTSITFKTTNVSNFSAIYGDIQEKVLGQFQVSSSDNSNEDGDAGEGSVEKAVTFVNIDTPHADVCEQTKKAMELEAADLAAQNAQEIFSTYAKRCNIKGSVEIAKIDQTAQGHDNFAPRYAKSAALESVGGHHVETNFRPISLTSQVVITFKYPHASFVCNNQ